MVWCMKRFLSVLILSCLSIGIATPTQASINIRQSQLEFEQALCRQNWREALQLSTELMNSPDVSQEYKNFLEVFQPMLSDYQHRAAWVANEPWCHTGIGDYEEEAQGVANLHPYWSGRLGGQSESAESAGGQ